MKREDGGFASLVSAALEERSLSVSAIWQLLLAVREPAPLNLLMEEIRKQPGAEFFFQAGNGLGVPPRLSLSFSCCWQELLSNSLTSLQPGTSFLPVGLNTYVLGETVDWLEKRFCLQLCLLCLWVCAFRFCNEQTFSELATILCQ